MYIRTKQLIGAAPHNKNFSVAISAISDDNLPKVWVDKEIQPSQNRDKKLRFWFW